jgi:hypothetical protein
MANVELRPMSLGEVLDRTFTLYREHFLLFVGIAALPNLLMLLFRFAVLLVTRTGSSSQMPNLSSPGAIGSAVVGGLVAIIILLLMVGITQAATVIAVSDLFLGREASIGNSYQQAKGSILTVIAIMIMTGLATGVGMIFLLIPGIYIACRLGLSVPASVVERDSPVSAMERSMELTKGYAGQVFLLFLLVLFLTYAVAGLLQFPVMFLAFKAAMARQQVSFGVSAYSYVADFLSQVIVGPIGTISAALMYYNLRVRKEGFDIQHMMSSLASVPRPLADPPGIR